MQVTAEKVSEKTRVQFDFTPEALETLDRLRKQLGVSSRAEVIRYSIRVLDWTLSVLSSGGKILVEKDGKVREVEFPFLVNQLNATNSTQYAASVSRSTF